MLYTWFPVARSAAQQHLEWGALPHVCSRSHRMAFVLETGSHYVAVWPGTPRLVSNSRNPPASASSGLGLKAVRLWAPEGRHYGKPAWPLVSLKLKTLLVSGLLLLLRSQLVSFWLSSHTAWSPSPQVMLPTATEKLGAYQKGECQPQVCHKGFPWSVLGLGFP